MTAHTPGPMPRKSPQQLLDEREEREWRRKHGPTLRKHFNAASFQLMLKKGEVPMPYAAAPALLEACKDLTRQVKADHEHLVGDFAGQPDDPEVIDLLRKAHAAIALAEKGGE